MTNQNTMAKQIPKTIYPLSINYKLQSQQKKNKKNNNTDFNYPQTFLTNHGC